MELSYLPLFLGRVRERSKGDTMCPTISQNPHWHLSWLSDASAPRKDFESKWPARDNPETNPITIKPETVSQVAEQFSWVPLSYCSLPGRPFPIKSLALLAHVCPGTVHFPCYTRAHSQALEGVLISATILCSNIHISFRGRSQATQEN